MVLFKRMFNKREYIKDKEIDSRLDYIYKLTKKLLGIRTNGNRQYEKYREEMEALERFLIKKEEIDKKFNNKK